MNYYNCSDKICRVLGRWYNYSPTEIFPVKLGSGYDQHIWVTDGYTVARLQNKTELSNCPSHWCVSYNEPSPFTIAPHVSMEQMGEPIMSRLASLERAARQAQETLRYGSPLFYMSPGEIRQRMRGFDIVLGDFGITFLK